MITELNKELIYLEECHRPGKKVPDVYRAYISERETGYCVVLEYESQGKQKGQRILKTVSTVDQAKIILHDNLCGKFKQDEGYELIKKVDNIKCFLEENNSTSKLKPAPKSQAVFEIPTPVIETNLTAWL